MEKNIFRNLLIASLFIFLPINLNLLVPTPALAATADTSVVIQPSSTEVTASPGQKIAKSFLIINRSNYYLQLKLVVKDYKQVSDNGKIEFYDAASQKASTWIIPQYLEIGLNPLETKQVGFVVSVPKDLSGGGHYGAILFQPVTGTQSLGPDNFGELVLLTVTGTNVKSAAVVKSVNFWTGFMQQGNPVDFNFKMQNTGNTQFDTQAKLVLQNWLGKEIGNYNIGQLTVYPQTDRVFQWRWTGTPFIGIYKAEVMLSDPGANNTFKPIDGEWFVIFPWEMTLIVLAVAVIVFAFARYGKKFYSFANSKIETISVPIKRTSR